MLSLPLPTILSCWITPCSDVLTTLLNTAFPNGSGLFKVWLHCPEDAPAQARSHTIVLDDIILVQARTGVLFAILVFMGVMARVKDPGFHKRMMILSIAVALPAGIDRIAWLPNTMPASPLAPDLYVLLAIAPMVLWDVFRNRRIHRAYWVWLAVVAPFTIAVHVLWNTPYWHAAARHLMRV